MTARRRLIRLHTDRYRVVLVAPDGGYETIGYATRTAGGSWVATDYWRQSIEFAADRPSKVADHLVARCGR